MTRLAVNKTWKLYIGGKFVRSESGEVQSVCDAQGAFLAHFSRASGKDVREAVEAAVAGRAALGKQSAYLRGQILYRIAEMLEARRGQFEEELRAQGWEVESARAELERTIDTWVHYAGWTDKFPALASQVNPVSSPHLNFSQPEPLGVVGLVAPALAGLEALTSMLAPLMAAGVAVVAVVPALGALSALSLGEVLATSDVPVGAVNLLAGEERELGEVLALHREVEALVEAGGEESWREELEKKASTHMKRTLFLEPEVQPLGPELLAAVCETKTTWHPVAL